MILNRKSVKRTSQVSLLIALVTIGVAIGTVDYDGLNLGLIAENCPDLRAKGLIELVALFFW